MLRIGNAWQNKGILAAKYFDQEYTAP
jgi:hypothetical protein